MSFTGLLAQTCTVRRKAAVSKTGTTISFADNGASPDQIKDSGNGLVTAGFAANMKVHVAGSTLNNGTYTVATAAAGAVTLSSADALSHEAAGATVTLLGVDSYGGPEYVWADSSTGVPCRLAPSGGREISLREQVVVADFVLELGGDADVTEEDEILLDGVTYKVLLVETFRNMFGAAHHKRAQLRLVRT